MTSQLRRIATVAATTLLVVAAAACHPTDGQHWPPQTEGDRAYYILPPGNYGGLPTTDESRDQLPLYSGLTPLRDHITDADIEGHFLPENLQPVGATREEPTGRPGTTIRYDEYGVAHVEGKTRADMAFGAGWVTARDRGLLIQLGRGPARAAVADVPGINAFGLVTSGQSFVPSAATEQLLTDQAALIVETYGDKGRQIIADAQAEADGITAYWKANNIDQAPATVNDVIATTAFIGSIFGAGGGAEASNAEFLSKLQNDLGAEKGRAAWEDAMLFEDPEAPTTTNRPFRYGTLTGGKVRGSVVIDEGSIESLDPRQPTAPPPATTTPPTTAPAPATTTTTANPPSSPTAPTPPSPPTFPTFPTPPSPPAPPTPPTFPTAARSAAEAPTDPAGYLAPTYPAAGPVPAKQASNFLVVDPTRSASRNSLAVMGPQLGYYYPEIVQQIHLKGPGIDAQGVAVPGAAMYLLIGRTQDYAWSLTSANHDVRDVFAEQLCNPDGSAPTRQSDHYLFKGECRPFEMFDAGTLNGTPIRYPTSVHGPKIGTATVGGQPFALTRQRSTFGRDGLNLAALKDMTEGKASTPQKFFRAANQFGFTFNWAYASRRHTAFFSSALLPKRARGLDRRLPTLGTGDYEWQGFLREGEHPHDTRGPDGLLLNWNNQSAPGFMHGDDAPFGSVHRVELFDQFPRRVALADDVGVMNRAATEDTRSPVWPVVSEVLHGSAAPNARAAKVVDLLDDWVRRDAPRLDADESGQYDDAGPTIMDALWQPVAETVMRPVYGDLVSDLNRIRGLGGLSGESYVDKDLRTLLRDPVRGRFNLRYCGNGSLDTCRASLWATVDQVAGDLAASQGPDPAAWRSPAATSGFTPGLIADRFPSTNRPTFQQVIEFDRHQRPRR